MEADYWKPVQAGYEEGTDPELVEQLLSNENSVIHQPLYQLKLAASPHIAAREEKIKISLDKIVESIPATSNTLIIEGAGGLMVPLNESAFVADLIGRLDAKVIIVSRNYLGSINHSLLTAKVCKEYGLSIAGWVFNDQFMHYEDEILRWTGLPHLASFGKLENINKETVRVEAERIKNGLKTIL